MTRLKALRTASNISQAALADMLNVKQNTISSWESGRTEPDFESVRKLSEIFEISADFILSAGIFEDWDLVMDNRYLVYRQLKSMIPSDFEMPANMHSDRLLIADLDIWFNYDPNELLLARWFQFAVRSIKFTPKEFPTSVSIEFTPEFKALLDQRKKKAPLTSEDMSGLTEKQIKILEMMGELPEQDQDDLIQQAEYRIWLKHQKESGQ